MSWKFTDRNNFYLIKLEFFIYVLTTYIQISEIKSFENHDNAKYMKICWVIQKDKKKKETEKDLKLSIVKFEIYLIVRLYFIKGQSLLYFLKTNLYYRGQDVCTSKCYLNWKRKHTTLIDYFILGVVFFNKQSLKEIT